MPLHAAQIRLETISGGKRSVVFTRRFHTMATPVPHHGNDGSTPWQRRSVALQQSEANFEVSNPSRCTNTPRNHFCRETLCRFHTPVPHHGNDGALPSNNPKQASRHQTHHTAQIRPQNHFWRETLRRFHTPVPHHGNDRALPSNNPKQALRYQTHHAAQIRLETISGGKRSVVSTRRFHTMATTERCPPTIRSKLRGIKPITNELIACPKSIS